MGKVAQEDSVDLIYNDLKKGQITPRHIFDRLSELENVQRLKGMSILKHIADESKFFSGKNTSTTQFQKLLTKCREEYMRFLDLEDATPKEIGFEQYLRKIMNLHKAPQREYDEIEDKDTFWQFVSKIEEHL